MSYRILSTPHIAELFHKPEGTELAKNDWYRAGKFLRGEYPKPLPRIREWTSGYSLRTIQTVVEKAPYLVIDTEYDRYTKELLTLGIGGPNTDIVQWWRYKPHRALEFQVQEALLDLIGSRGIVFQNAFADLPVLKKAFSIVYEDFKRIDDTLLADSVLYNELLHGLEEATRRVGQYEKLKHLPFEDPRYNAGDVAETISYWESCKREFQQDRQSEWIYENSLLPLIPIILEAQYLGLRVDRERVQSVGEDFREQREYAIKVASAYCGFPINLGSPGKDGQLGKYLEYDLPKNWGFKRPIKKKEEQPLITSVDEDTIAELRGKILPFDPKEEMNIDVLNRRIAESGHPVLEARVLYAHTTQSLSHYIKPLLSTPDGRIYPEFHPWAQNTGRWSTVKPPMAQLPRLLRPTILPDEGWIWWEGDWSAIELRLIAALSQDPIMLEAFSKNWDLHTFHMCDAFMGIARIERNPLGWTKEEIAEDVEWVQFLGGKEFFESFRTFLKSLVFSLCYGGVPESIPSIPGAKKFGIPDPLLIQAGKNWIRSHPAIKKFWSTIQRESLHNRIMRTFLGRRWVFFGQDKKRILRQMYDFPMQGAVADIMNLTLIRSKKELGNRVRLSYTMHDSLKLQVRKTPTLDKDIELIQNIFEQSWTINRKGVSFPGEYHTRG